MNKYIEQLDKVAATDVVSIKEKDKEYGGSWLRRGGVGAFMMLARKWDRLENQVEKVGWDVLKAAQDDTRPEGVVDDIRDLRRYLLLVEAELAARAAAPVLRTGVVLKICCTHSKTFINQDGDKLCSDCGAVVVRLFDNNCEHPAFQRKLADTGKETCGKCGACLHRRQYVDPKNGYNCCVDCQEQVIDQKP